MAKDIGPSANGVIRKSAELFLPFRRFVDRPTTPFIEEVLQYLRETAAPEMHEALYRNQIPKDVQFFILREVVLDGKKRQDCGNAPCPMCAKNKFLRGALIYIPKMECCAVIGHCCAGKQAQADADREFRWRKKRDHEESYLLDNLALVTARLEVLRTLKPVAIDARRLYREFRRGASKVQFQLRQVRLNYGGQLVLSEIIRGREDDDENDYVGPSGFRSRGSDIETREHNFGILAGGIATIKNYDPVKELDWLIRQLSSIDSIPSEDNLLEFLTRITERQRSAAVAIMEAVDKGVVEFIQRVREFMSFFTLENAERLNAFGTSEHNSQPFEVAFGHLKGRPVLVIKYQGTKCSFHVGESCHGFQFAWPMKI